jgi:hypothetical protein
VPGGGLAPDGRWVGCKPNFFLPVRVLSRLYRRLFLERLQAAFDKAELAFFGNLAHLAEPAVFAPHVSALRNVEWNVYAKRPFGGPQQVMEYLGRYTHRVAIANSRLVACESGDVRFRWKDYRANNKSKVMTLGADEFMRRFLLHVLPKGFRRIRHFGFLANACRTAKLAVIRAALQTPQPAPAAEHADYRERYAMLTGHRIDLCPCAAAAWSRSVYVHVHRHRRAPHHAATPHDIRTRPFAHHSRYRTADALRRKDDSHLQAIAGAHSSAVFCHQQQLVLDYATIPSVDSRHLFAVEPPGAFNG